MLLIISLLACFWNFSRLKDSSSLEQSPAGSNSDSSLQSNVDNLINIRTNDVDDEVPDRNYAISYT